MNKFEFQKFPSIRHFDWSTAEWRNLWILVSKISFYPSFRLEYSGMEKPLKISCKDFLLSVISTGAQRNGKTF
ncbi:hypothetical protein ACFOG5_02920 [Pedobacter fastidiosus]|uniref:hypothetical protein n=1 Tax=Pedobacter fastidiosus TaxID=2765361 RepID=UPI003617A1B2